MHATLLEIPRHTASGIPCRNPACPNVLDRQPIEGCCSRRCLLTVRYRIELTEPSRRPERIRF